MKSPLSAALCLTILAACSPAQEPAPKSPDAPAAKAPDAPAKAPSDAAHNPDEVFTVGATKFKVEVVASELQVPWDMCWDGGDRLLFTERPGRLREIKGGKLNPAPLFELKDTYARGESGLMGLCLHPTFAENRYAYVAYSKGGEDKKPVDVRVVRLKEVGGAFVEDKLIISGAPLGGGNHAGCLVRFGPDAKLYITFGERFEKELAQKMDSLGGKTVRLNDDGSVPKDNPFVDAEADPQPRPEIWSFGHRNAQGMDWQAGTGLMFQCEHGPSGEAGGGGDEVNIVEKGKNYGWPVIHHGETKDGMEPPILFWNDAIAPASCVFYNADKFPEFKGNLLVGALGGLRGNSAEPGIYRIVLDGRKVVSKERMCTTYGRIRRVAVGPDGLIYFTTSNQDRRARPKPGDDKIMRLVPVK